MVRPPSIDNHAMQCTRLSNNLIHGLRHTIFLSDICLHDSYSAREAFGDDGELVAGFGDVDRVDFGGAIAETAFCYAESDSAICAGD